MLEIFSIAFSQTKEKPMAEKYQLLQKVGSLEALFQIWLKNPDAIDLEWMPILDRCSQSEQAKWQWEITQKQNAWLWIWGQYPNQLTQLLHPPMVLFGQGKKPTMPLLSVVGTRTPTPYGKRITKSLVESLSVAGLGIVSGMARGIDSIAHQTALDQNQYTCVVLAHGLDQTYPKENEKLKKQVLEKGGMLISEYPWGKPPVQHHFRDRNRINAALSDAVLVVEAGQNSGTKITVHEGLLLDRPIFSVPGPIDSTMSEFPNQLIQDGALMVHHISVVLDAFGLQEQGGKSQKMPVHDNLQKTLLSFFDKDEPKSIEEFFAVSSGNLGEILQSVTALEINQRIQKQVDGRYLLV